MHPRFVDLAQTVQLLHVISNSQTLCGYPKADSHSAGPLLEQHPVVIGECEQSTEQGCESREQQLKKQQTHNITGSQQCAPCAPLPPEHARDGGYNNTLDDALTTEGLKALHLYSNTRKQQQGGDELYSSKDIKEPGAHSGRPMAADLDS